MNKAWILVRSVILASMMPALAFVLVLLLLDEYLTLGNSVPYFASASVVSASHVLVLGLPAVFALRVTDRLTFLSLAATGFLVGMLPVAIIFLIQWATEPGVSVICHADPQCAAALAGSRVGIGRILTVVAAGLLGFFAALSFYASSRKAWLFQNLPAKR